MTREAQPGLWTIYILRCADDSFYVGISNQLRARVAAHNSGKGARYTRARRPVQLCWRLDVESGEEARRLEGLMKRLKRKEREALVDGDLDVIAPLWEVVQARRRARASRAAL